MLYQKNKTLVNVSEDIYRTLSWRNYLPI